VPLSPRFLAPLAATLDAMRPPSLCAVCRSWGRQRVCDDCLERWAAPVARCRRCAIDVAPGISVCGPCLLRPPPYAGAVAALDYAYPWDRLMARFKFNAGLDLVALFSQRLCDAVQAAHLDRPSVIVPVPLSASRLRERGYNQAWELARRLAPALDCRADAHLLLRVRDSAHQIELPPDARAANVKDVFAVEPLRAPELRDRQVAIVDDVMTTGATAAELAGTLLRAGAAAVQVWVVARTPRPDR
jgi:ComF family protein